MRFTLALLAALASSNSLAAPPLPAAVREVVRTMSADCKSVGGKPGSSPSLVSTIDVNGDGQMDYVIYTASFVCTGAESLFVGAGGGSVEVFVSAPDGRAASVFEHGASDMRVQQGQVWLAVRGPLCGQKVTDDTPLNEMHACWRSLQWDASHRRLDFAPLSSVQPYK